MPNRLTGEVFATMLEKHPRFSLITGCWALQARPCSGCALTLAYYDRDPEAHAGKLTMTPVREWARKEYGTCYVAGFTAAFDGDIDLGGNESQGYADGTECLAVAMKAGRLA